jgi:hypothetical protein
VKTCDELGTGYAKMVKTTKAKVRHRVVRTQKSAKARVMTKLKMIRGDNTVHIDTTVFL